MASEVPVVASNIAVHREICGDAAVYFERFSPESLADGIVRIANGADRVLVRKGLARAKDFSWKIHVEKIIELAQLLINSASFSQKHSA